MDNSKLYGIAGDMQKAMFDVFDSWVSVDHPALWQKIQDEKKAEAEASVNLKDDSMGHALEDMIRAAAMEREAGNL